jgi:hypothetical protein
MITVILQKPLLRIWTIVRWKHTITITTGMPEGKPQRPSDHDSDSLLIQFVCASCSRLQTEETRGLISKATLLAEVAVS